MDRQESSPFLSGIWVSVWVRRVEPGAGRYYLREKVKESPENQRFSGLLWLRGKDLNQRPPGYEPDELPAALPRDILLAWIYYHNIGGKSRLNFKFFARAFSNR